MGLVDGHASLHVPVAVAGLRHRGADAAHCVRFVILAQGKLMHEREEVLYMHAKSVLVTHNLASVYEPQPVGASCPGAAHELPVMEVTTAQRNVGQVSVVKAEHGKLATFGSTQIDGEMMLVVDADGLVTSMQPISGQFVAL